jgi:Ca-activated chloride channel family protein
MRDHGTFSSHCRQLLARLRMGELGQPGTVARQKAAGIAFHRSPIFLIFLLLVCGVISEFPLPVASQSLVTNDARHDTPGQVIKNGESIHLDVDLALVYVTVTDPYNRLVTGLEPDNFSVFENNVEQEIVDFSSEDLPISIGVILDFSGSMVNKVGKAKEAAIQFLKTANPQDEFFLIAFNDRAQLLSPFTDDVEDLQSRLLSTNPKGSTALLDAVYLGLSEMRSARNAKRALLIISDGGDNHSRYSPNDIKRLVKESDTQLYSIGIFDPLQSRARTPEELSGPSLLSEVTEHTGGRAFTVENVSDLPDIAAKIGMELRNQYVQATRRMTRAGERSRSSCTLPKDSHRSAFTQREVITHSIFRTAKVYSAL